MTTRIPGEFIVIIISNDNRRAGLYVKISGEAVLH